MALATFVIFLSLFTMTNVFPQNKIPLIKASFEKVSIKDGAYCHVDWKLDPKANPDVYFVNIPTKESTVVFKTDQEELTVMTKPGVMYDFIVLLNGTDSCHIRINYHLIYLYWIKMIRFLCQYLFVLLAHGFS